MSPARSKSPGSQRNDLKPYTRGVTPIMTPSVSHVPHDSNTSRIDERPGFPTYAQYKQVESSYIQSLTPRRQAKALISQSMFDRIWDVLHQPDCQGETAQFRFWARKMFTVSKNYRNTLGAVANNDEAPQEVLLHDNLLVAVQEQLYDLLCYCHASTGHGGRDKTCALIRKHYTWVPKDLVSSFIKACPTCILKKCGNLDSSASVPSNAYDSRIEDMSLPALREFYQNVYSQDQAMAATSSALPGIVWPSMTDSGCVPIRPILLEDDPLDAAYREAILRARNIKAMAGITVSTQRGLRSLPMSREVSLYKGLPNGWQFRHDDYTSAHAEFMQTRHLPVQDSDLRNPRPRVPSIAPLWGPNDYPRPEFDNSNDLGLAEADIHFSGQARDSYPPMTMQYILSGSNKRLEGPGKEGEITHQIDPTLMAGEIYDEDKSIIAEVALGADPFSESSHLSSSSIKRAAAPPRLNLDALPTEKSFQALLAYRESLGDGNTSPDSPMMNWHPGNPSPASSFGSCVSHLGYIPSPSPANSLSPPTTALPTPVDDYGTDAPGNGNFVKGKGKLTLPETAAMELSSSIDVVGDL